MNPIIQLKKVNFWYDHGKPTEMWALHDINLEINQGEYVAFFGPSGSGKTTLLYLLSGTEMSQDGEVIVNGKDISKFSKAEMAIYRQMGVGMVFQQFNLIPTLSVLDNVALPMAFLGVGQVKRSQEPARLLERLNLTSLAKRFPYELSGGQQQRVGIARALANNAPIIVADEPIGNLDSANANNVLDFLKELQEKDGKTVIMVTHEAWSLRDAKKIFFLKDGVVEKVEEGHEQSPAAALQKKINGESSPTQSREEVMAVTMANLLFRGASADEAARFNQFLFQRLSNKIGRDQFFNLLHRSFREGGGGLWRPRALQVSRYVEDVIAERASLEKVTETLTKNPAAPLAHDVDQVIEWLLEDRKIKMDEIQHTRMREIVEETLRNIITPESFKDLLYLPKSRLGLGLSHRATEDLYEKFKIAMDSPMASPLTA